MIFLVKKILLLLFVVSTVWAVPSKAQKNASAGNAFPGLHWQPVSRPEDMGFSSQQLLKAKEFGDSIHSASVMVIVHGKLVYQWGRVEEKINVYSIRKSFLSAIYGKYVKLGIINLDATMADLGLDDKPPLSEEEKKATIRDCLKARSGVYHPTIYETEGMKQLKPARYSEKPGTHWYYNNWDFNVLGTIFEKLTHKKIFEEINDQIAKPIGMEDYTPADGAYYGGEESIYPAYPIQASARDLARFGLLMLNKGNWNGTQLIDSAWVEESTRYHSDATLYSSDGYGYLWWVSRNFNKFPHMPNVKLPEGTFSARGAGGHLILIIPKYDMVIVHRVFQETDPNPSVHKNAVSNALIGQLINMILKAGNKN
jgi:CubicO group peptidase (beta-lactamase class C family)